MTDLNTVAVWFQAAKPGDQLVYHEGNLAFDRFVSAGISYAEHENKQSLGAAAAFLWKAYKDGAVHLVQRRIDKEVCAYIAVRAQPHR